VSQNRPHIRPAGPADAPTMARVHIETWRTDYRGFAPDDYLDTLLITDEQRVYEQIIGSPDSMAFVAEDGARRVLGLSTCGPYRDEGHILDGSFSGELYNLYVVPDARKLGVGRDLVRAAAAGLPPEICCHTFRATGITSYLLNGGEVSKAQKIANHESRARPSSTTRCWTRGWRRRACSSTSIPLSTCFLEIEIV